MTRITWAAAAEEIGCNPSTVRRAAKRLGLDAAEGLTRKQVRQLADTITPGGRGHWLAGRRRNPDRGEWGRLRLALSQFIDDHPRPGVISYRALAAELGVTDRTVRRWVHGEDRPGPDAQDAIAAWLTERRDQLALEAKRRGK